MRTQKNGRKRGRPGNGIGPHQLVSAMARGTKTKSKRDLQDRLLRKEQRNGFSW